MEERKVFCAECRNDVDFFVSQKQMEGSIKGKAYSYIGEEAHCAECGSKIHVDTVNDYNLNALNNVYREKNNIIPLDMILAIPEKYAIEKRPLSLLLGWGEHTFSRYYDGDMLTKQHSKILQKIYDDPHYYMEILESNKGNLEIAAYSKSRKAVDALLGMTQSTKANIGQKS